MRKVYLEGLLLLILAGAAILAGGILNNRLPDLGTKLSGFCSREEKRILAELEKANFCQNDADCVIESLGCPFPCLSLTNKEASFPEIRSAAEIYFRRCGQCRYDCAPFSGKIVCRGGRCRYEPSDNGLE